MMNRYKEKFLYSLLVFVMAAGLISIVASGGGGDSNEDDSSPSSENSSTERITVTGTFSGTAVSGASVAGMSVKSMAVDPSTATEIIAFDTDNNSISAEITDGAFSIDVYPDTRVGFIFVGSSNEFLGYLTFADGLETLPLNYVEDGVTSIDLGTLSTDGTTVTPGHNPIGDEIPITDEEKEALAQCNSIFASLAKNPDVDGDGAIDFLEDEYYHPWVAYWVNAGYFNGSYTPTLSGAFAISNYNISFATSETADQGGATVTGPDGSGLTDYSCTESSDSEGSEYSVYPDLGTSPTAIPVAGDYVFSLSSSNKTLTFNIPDQSEANSRIVVAVPTVTLNSDGTINKIDWVYRLPNSDTNLTAEAIISSIIVEIDTGSGRAYDSDNLTNVTSHTLTDQTISWSDVTRIYMAYNDVYGNHNVITFRMNENS